MAQMLYVKANKFLLDTFKLGKLVYESGFRPRHAISIWRGGTPVGLGVDSFFRSRGFLINHTTIATGSYSGIGQQGEVAVKNLEHLVKVVCSEDGLLIIDDVYESGNTIKRVLELIRAMARANTPVDIRVATVHNKPGKKKYGELPLYSLYEVDNDVWIDYPHELSDLVSEHDPQDSKIRQKSEEVWRILHRKSPISEWNNDGEYIYLSARELLHDSIRLGVLICQDKSWEPDYLLALWPGGVVPGLPVHEVYKYNLRKSNRSGKAPDHISINTSPTRLSYRNAIVGLNYLQEQINKDDNVLIIDTTFRAGRLVNDVVMRLKEVLRRNLNHNRIRVACVYYNPSDQSTWTVQPGIQKPDYYLREVNQEIVFPASVHKLPDARKDLELLNPELGHILFGS